MKKRRIYHCTLREPRGARPARAGLERGELGGISGAVETIAEKRIESKHLGGHFHDGRVAAFNEVLQIIAPRVTPEDLDHARALREESPMPAHPPDDGSERPKWISKWEFERAGKRVTIVVVANGPAGQETIDAREFIERLGEDDLGTTFAIHVEAEQKA